MSKSRHRPYLLIIMLFSLLPAIDAQAQGGSTPYRVETTLWRAAGGQLAAWRRVGVTLASGGALQLDPQQVGSQAGRYGPGRYRRGTLYVGEATGPVVTTAFPFSERYLP